MFNVEDAEGVLLAHQAVGTTLVGSSDMSLQYFVVVKALGSTEVRESDANFVFRQDR